MPTYIASGGHYFGNMRYRFLILPRYEFDLHSITKSRQVETKNILIIADQLIDILEHIHDNGYAHSDIKAENIMIGKCTYKKKKAVAGSKSVSATKNGGARGNGRRRKTDPIHSGYTHEFDLGGGGVVNNGNRHDNRGYREESEDRSTGSDTDLEKRKDKDFMPMSSRRETIEFGGSNPVRTCRMENKNQMYEDMVTSHYLRRQTKKVNYCENENDEDKPLQKDDDDDWTRKHKYAKRTYHNLNGSLLAEVRKGCDGEGSAANLTNGGGGIEHAKVVGGKSLTTEDRIHLIDFGLALKFVDSNGMHRPFVMDQRRAHDGTLEFTSRDAHMGAHSRRSDLECLAYNLIYWKEGFLPWKNEKIMSQPEQVHRLKEYFMTDIKQMYKKIYNVPIPTFINDFLTHVANLAYHDRPDYKLCKEIFRKEFQRLGHKKNKMVLNVAELKAAPLRKPDAEDADTQQIGHKLLDVAKMMKMGMIMPFCETPTSHTQISPKNLRSKSTQNPKKRPKKFSWTEILSTDPDQIARQRAEKEFEREEQCDQTPVHRYTGKPTYAILQIENSKMKSKLDSNRDNTIADTHGSENTIKGYTKPMMDVWRKRQLYLLEQFQINANGESTPSMKTTASAAPPAPPTPGLANGNGKARRKKSKPVSETSDKSFASGVTAEDVQSTVQQHQHQTMATNDELITPKAIKSRKRKSGLRRVVTPTKKILSFRNSSGRRRKATPFKTTAIADSTTTITAPPIVNDSLTFFATNECSICSCNNDLSEASSHSSNVTAGSVSIADGDENSKRFSRQSRRFSADIKNRLDCLENRLARHHQHGADRGLSSPASEDEHDNAAVANYGRAKTRHARARATTALKPIVMSDEESRDTTDYSPVKTRHKRSKDGKHNRKTKKRSNGRGKLPFSAFHSFKSIGRQSSPRRYQLIH